MLDFTSALYLGLRHPSGALRPWKRFTTGMPAALGVPISLRRITEALAALQGCERATLGASTLHLFWDLFGLLAPDRFVVYQDAGAYAVVRWGLERAAARGMPVRRFGHHDVETLRVLLRQDARLGSRPLVVTDGFCPGCGNPAPLPRYLEVVRAFDGCLILDDTQALGILGDSPGSGVAFGRGGGGSLCWHRVAGPELLTVSSLAKGFGVPMAVLSGSDQMVRWFENNSETRTHCSPPSVAVIHAAEHALRINQARGDALRRRLADLVGYLRERLARIGCSSLGGMFPVQTLELASIVDPRTFHSELLKNGIRTVLRRSHTGSGACISILITARHSKHDVDRAVHAIARILEQRAPEMPAEEITYEHCIQFRTRAV